MAKLTPDDLLTHGLVTELVRNTEQNTLSMSLMSSLSEIKSLSHYIYMGGNSTVKNKNLHLSNQN